MTDLHRRRPSTAAVVIALLAVYIVWGSTYLAIAIVIETMPPLLTAGARFLAAGALLLGAVAAHDRLRPSGVAREPIRLEHWRTAFVVGTLLLLGGNGGVVLAELRIPSGIAAVLVATVPIWLAFFDALLTRRRPSGLVIGGLVAGIVGVAILLVPVEGLDDIDPLGVALVVAGALSWAAGSIYARHAPRPSSGFAASALTMIGGGVALLIGGLLLGELAAVEVSAFSARSVAAFAYLVLVGSLVGFTAYTWLLAHVPVSVVGTYAYVNPIVAVALGALILSEPITLRTVLAATIIVGAVVAMVSGRPRQAEEPGPSPETAPLEPDEAASTDPAAEART